MCLDTVINDEDMDMLHLQKSIETSIVRVTRSTAGVQSTCAAEDLEISLTDQDLD